jgi:sulfatase maturation enzyme AslB (radical SAM superfamily)
MGQQGNFQKFKKTIIEGIQSNGGDIDENIVKALNQIEANL